MLRICRSDGKFKKPVVAVRSHGSEFLVYVTDFTTADWDDVYKNRVAIITVAPSVNWKTDIQNMIDYEGLSINYVLVGTVI